MALVQAQVEQHYRSSIVEKIKSHGGELTVGNTTIRLAKQFGFCYGVERAIDLAYATRKVFPDQRIFLIGEIIHNCLQNNGPVFVAAIPFDERCNLDLRNFLWAFADQRAKGDEQD